MNSRLFLINLRCRHKASRSNILKEYDGHFDWKMQVGLLKVRQWTDSNRHAGGCRFNRFAYVLGTVWLYRDTRVRVRVTVRKIQPVQDLTVNRRSWRKNYYMMYLLVVAVVFVIAIAIGTLMDVAKAHSTMKPRANNKGVPHGLMALYT